VCGGKVDQGQGELAYLGWETYFLKDKQTIKLALSRVRWVSLLGG